MARTLLQRDLDRSDAAGELAGLTALALDDDRIRFDHDPEDRRIARINGLSDPGIRFIDC